MSDLQFEPKKEEELATLLELGVGSYEVLTATAKNSKNNNPMIEMVLRVWDSIGNQGQIFDYLILNNNNFSLKKIRHFCYSAGLEQAYEQGGLNAHQCIGKCGKLQIGIQKDKEKKYPDKNCVNDYIFVEKNEVSKDSIDESLDDDIPF